MKSKRRKKRADRNFKDLNLLQPKPDLRSMKQLQGGFKNQGIDCISAMKIIGE